MGCGSSSGGQTVVQDMPTESKPPTKRTGSGRSKVAPLSVEDRPAKEYDSDIESDLSPAKPKSKKSRNFLRNGSKRSLGSSTSLGVRSANSISLRGNSATSKNSKHSTDSGLGEGDCDHPNMITEDSDHAKIEQVKNEFSPNDDLELGIMGVGCQQRLSAKDKARMEEQRVLLALRDEGFIARPKTRASGGMSYDIMMDGPDANAFKRPPPRLAKLDKKRKKKKDLTQEEIKAKLERAEQRRKLREQERLDKIAQADKSKDTVVSALDAFAEHQKTIEKVIVEKDNTAEINREKRLKEIRDKLKAKEEHAEKVRQRKKLAPITPHPDSDASKQLEQL